MRRALAALAFAPLAHHTLVLACRFAEMRCAMRTQGAATAHAVNMLCEAERPAILRRAAAHDKRRES